MADFIVQALLEGIVEVVAHVGVLATKARSEKKRERVLAAADLLVLAAHHDHQVSAAEREELGARCAKVLGGAGVELDVPSLLVRWEDERAALVSEQRYAQKVQELADSLASSDKPKVLAAVEAVLSAETADGTLAIYRSALE